MKPLSQHITESFVNEANKIKSPITMTFTVKYSSDKDSKIPHKFGSILSDQIGLILGVYPDVKEHDNVIKISFDKNNSDKLIDWHGTSLQHAFEQAIKEVFKTFKHLDYNNSIETLKLS